jgi:hypothetical protein
MQNTERRVQKERDTSIVPYSTSAFHDLRFGWHNGENLFHETEYWFPCSTVTARSSEGHVSDLLWITMGRLSEYHFLQSICKHLFS